MAVVIPILDRARKYGYIMWRKDRDFDMKKYFRDVDEIVVIFEGKDLGRKRVDWRYRRISIGWTNTRNIPAHRKDFDLLLHKDGRLFIKCQ